MNFLQQPPRFLFFTGKGGVGKTSIACATAVLLRPGTAECTRADIDCFLPQIELIPFKVDSQ